MPSATSGTRLTGSERGCGVSPGSKELCGGGSNKEISLKTHLLGESSGDPLHSFPAKASLHLLRGTSEPPNHA